MKILVTGGAGFIGSNVVRLLISRGHQVLCFDKLTYAGNRNSLSDVEQAPGFRFLKADICDAGAVRSAFVDFQPDCVMHLAAESHMDRSIERPGDFIQTNIVGTYTMLEAAKAYMTFKGSAADGFRFLHVSTDEVYGSLGDTGFFTEETPYDPRSPYSASKASSDHLARAWFHTTDCRLSLRTARTIMAPTNFLRSWFPWCFFNRSEVRRFPFTGKAKIFVTGYMW